MQERTYHILLVEDNPGDVRLTQEALKESSVNIQLHVVSDGEEALEFLFKKGKHKTAVNPDLVLLDLNLPRKNGLEVLKELKADESLKNIPITILTTSEADHDIRKGYANHVNSYIIKPVDFDEFTRVIKMLESYWFKTVRLPKTAA